MIKEIEIGNTNIEQLLTVANFEQMVLIEENQIDAVFMPGTYSNHSINCSKPHSRLFLVNMSLCHEKAWSINLYSECWTSMLYIKGTLSYQVGDGIQSMNAIIKKDLINRSGARLGDILMEEIVERRLASILYAVLGRNSLPTDIDLVLLSRLIANQLEMFFIAYGLSLQHIVITDYENIPIDLNYVDSLSFAETLEELSWPSEEGFYSDCYDDCDDWDGGEYYNSWANSAWANSSGSMGCSSKNQLESMEPPSDAQFQVSVPKNILPGEIFPLNIAMYVERYKAEALEVLSMTATNCSDARTGTFNVKNSSYIKIRLLSEDIEIADDECTRTWNGQLAVFNFLIKLPDTYQNSKLRIQARIYVDDVELTDLKCVINVGVSQEKCSVDNYPLRSAFVSYSSKDRALVAARMQGMMAVTDEKMDIFFDVESLHCGEDWEKRIRQEITSRSLFYLFWSRNAMVSEWVRRELDIALETKDIHDIVPIPLESPEVCPPPKELQGKHFFNRLLLYTHEPKVISMSDKLMTGDEI